MNIVNEIGEYLVTLGKGYRHKIGKVNPTLLYQFDNEVEHLRSLGKIIDEAYTRTQETRQVIIDEIKHREDHRQQVFNYSPFTAKISPADYWISNPPEQAKRVYLIEFTSLKTTRAGWGAKSMITSIIFSYRWPNCGCEFYVDDKLFLRQGRMNSQKVVPHVIKFVGNFLRETYYGNNDPQCPRCQTCSQELDYLCDGFEEPKPLTADQGKFVWLSKGDSWKQGPLLEVEGEVEGKVRW